MTGTHNLTEKYRPKTLADIVGQPWIVEQLTEFVDAPVSTAFLFEGGTGTGKTSTALVLAAALGVDVAAGPLGGLHVVPAGEQTGERVRETFNSLRLYTLSGSGWKVLVVNEADYMTANASHVWLDALENLPPRTVVIFTTNYAGKIPARIRDRCESFRFESGYIALAPFLADFVAKVWKSETGREDAPSLDDLGAIQDENGDVSVRRVLQLLTPLVRQAASARPAPIKSEVTKGDLARFIRATGLPGRVKIGDRTLAALANGPKKIEDLANELGIPKLVNMKRTLRDLEKEGRVRPAADGTYCLTMRGATP